MEKNPKTELAEGEILFEKYRIEKIVGRGGYGRVYKARDTLMDRDVAVKELLVRYADNPLVVRRFIQEARSAGRLQHPNIITVFNLERSLDSGRFYLIMEYIDGASLRQICRKKPRLQPQHVEKIAAAVLSGLQHAHLHSVIHRDIKPDNIMVTTDERIKIADFGVAKLPVNKGGFTQLSNAGVPAGTAAYLSPEQIRGEELTITSDLYSLGVMLYELSTGQFYFNVASCKSFYEVGKEILHTVPRPPSQIVSEIPQALDQLICGLLVKDATARIQSAQEALDMLIAGSTTKQSTPVQSATDDAQHEGMEIQVAADLSALDSQASATEEDPNMLPQRVEKLSALRWSFEAASAVEQVVVYDRYVFLLTQNGLLFMLCSRTGRELWRSVEQGVIDSERKCQGQLALSPRHIASLGSDGTICLYDWQQEKLLWKKALPQNTQKQFTPPLQYWDPRAAQRKHHLFWYGNLLYLFSLGRNGNAETVILSALELDDGSMQQLIDTGFSELVSVVLAPTNASQLVEGHLWAISRRQFMAVDLLSSKVLKHKSSLQEIEQLSLHGHFPQGTQSGSGISRASIRKKKVNTRPLDQYYSGFIDSPVFIAVDALQKKERLISAVDCTSLETLWTRSLAGEIDHISRSGALQEVLFSDFSVYVICERGRTTLAQLDIHAGEVQSVNNFKDTIVWFDHGSTGYLVMLASGVIAEYSHDRNEMLWSYALNNKLSAGYFHANQDSILVLAEGKLLAFE